MGGGEWNREDKFYNLGILNIRWLDHYIEVKDVNLV